jgi:CheY-like chemotaxis protein
VVDDSAAVRDAICHVIDGATPFKACCEAGDGVAAIEKAKERVPALVVMDLSMPRMNGVEAASVLRGMLSGMKIVGLTTFNEEIRTSILEETSVFDMILSKHDGLAKLPEAIKALLPEALPQAGVGDTLLPPFDIFKVAGDGHPVWVQSSLTLDDANARIQTLGLEFAGTYIIHSQKTGYQTVVTVNKTGGLVQ